jgi:hypothetical protein
VWKDEVVPVLEYKRLSSLEDSGSVTDRKTRFRRFDLASLDSEGFSLSVHCGTSCYNV